MKSRRHQFPCFLRGERQTWWFCWCHTPSQ
jgi:hypothetical protein